MGAIATAFIDAFRAYNSDGVPGSGVYAPEKALAQALGALIEATIPPKTETIILVGTAHTITADHWNQWLEIDDGGGGATTVTLGDGVPEGQSTFGAQAGTGQLTFEGDTGFTVLVDELSNPTTACQGAVWQAQRLDATTWRVFGRLEAA
jgi:hypothetical protein